MDLEQGNTPGGIEAESRRPDSPRQVTRVVGTTALATGRWAWRLACRATRRPRWWAWRWWHFTRVEPLTAPAEAIAGLRLIGYTPRPGFRIARVRPGVARWRLGVWITIEPAERSSRHWRVQHVRFVDDPIEWWLLRSALAGVSSPAPDLVPPPVLRRAARRSDQGLFDRMAPEELDRLLTPPGRRRR